MSRAEGGRGGPAGHLMTSAAITETPAGLRIALRVIPRSSKTAIEGERDGRLLVKVTAPPVDAAANGAVIELIARRLGVPKRSVTIAAGAMSKNKVVAVAGIGRAEAAATLLESPERIKPGHRPSPGQTGIEESV